MSTFLTSHAQDNEKRFTKQITQKYEARPSVVFPLLCPVKELDWLDGWSTNMIYTKSGFAEVGCVFTTKFPGEESESIWVWTKQDIENYEVQFFRIVPGIVVMHATICLEDDFSGNSNAKLTYEYTLLNEETAHKAENIIKTEMSMIGWMEKLINHYLKTGKKFIVPNSPIK